MTSKFTLATKVRSDFQIYTRHLLHVTMNLDNIDNNMSLVFGESEICGILTKYQAPVSHARSGKLQIAKLQFCKFSTCSRRRQQRQQRQRQRRRRRRRRRQQCAQVISTSIAGNTPTSLAAADEATDAAMVAAGRAGACAAPDDPFARTLNTPKAHNHTMLHIRAHAKHTHTQSTRDIEFTYDRRSTNVVARRIGLLCGVMVLLINRVW